MIKPQQRCDESLRVGLSIEPLHLRTLKINTMIYSLLIPHFDAIFFWKLNSSEAKYLDNCALNTGWNANKFRIWIRSSEGSFHKETWFSFGCYLLAVNKIFMSVKVVCIYCYKLLTVSALIQLCSINPVYSFQRFLSTSHLHYIVSYVVNTFFFVRNLLSFVKEQKRLVLIKFSNWI